MCVLGLCVAYHCSMFFFFFLDNLYVKGDSEVCEHGRVGIPDSACWINCVLALFLTANVYLHMCLCVPGCPAGRCAGLQQVLSGSSGGTWLKNTGMRKNQSITDSLPLFPFCPHIRIPKISLPRVTDHPLDTQTRTHTFWRDTRLPKKTYTSNRTALRLKWSFRLIARLRERKERDAKEKPTQRNNAFYLTWVHRHNMDDLIY